MEICGNAKFYGVGRGGEVKGYIQQNVLPKLSLTRRLLPPKPLN